MPNLSQELISAVQLALQPPLSYNMIDLKAYLRYMLEDDYMTISVIESLDATSDTLRTTSAEWLNSKWGILFDEEDFQHACETIVYLIQHMDD